MLSTNSFKVLLAAGAMALAAGGANAVTMVPCDFSIGETNYDVTDYVQPSSSCFGLQALSDGSGAKLNELNALNINGTVGGWTTLGRFNNTGSNTFFSVDDSDEDDQVGEWSLFAAATTVYGEFMMVFKAGQDRNTLPAAFVGYILAGTSGTWSSPLLNDENGDPRDLSNVELYARGTPAPIPVPAAGFLMIGALGGLAALRRRRRAV